MTDAVFFKKIFEDIYFRGKEIRPRGQLVLEREDYSFSLPPHVRFCSFKVRKLNIDYIRREFLWYLRGDKFDASICDHAKTWKTIQNKDGSFNSNYGQYVFGQMNQFSNVVKTLSADPDSRRASIVILSSDHLFQETNDLPCTYSLNFRIRDNKLNVSVIMRSMDAVWGMGNDVPCFSFIHEMVANALKLTYPSLQLGGYHHHVNSIHVYERHFDMLKTIATEPTDDVVVTCPKISGPAEVDFIRRCDFSIVPEGFKFASWLTEVDG